MQCRIIQFRRCQSGSWVMDLSWPRIQFRTVHNPSSFKTCTQLVAKYKIDVRIERKHARLGVVIGLLQNIPLPRSHLAAGPAARQVSFFWLLQSATAVASPCRGARTRPRRPRGRGGAHPHQRGAVVRPRRARRRRRRSVRDLTVRRCRSLRQVMIHIIIICMKDRALKRAYNESMTKYSSNVHIKHNALKRICNKKHDQRGSV